MNFRLVAKLLSVIMLTMSVAFTLCLIVSLLLDGTNRQWQAREAFIITIAVSLLAALACARWGRNAPKKFFRKEALGVVGIGWILASLLGSVPYLLVTPHLGISGAIFESASGLTTTGATVLSDLESLPPSLLFWRALSQWIGGIGVVVFFVAILGFLGAGAKLLYAKEASVSTTEFEESRVQSTVLHLIYVYLGISLCCASAYRLCGMSVFDSICHMFTTVSTAGFSTRSGSIADFHSAAVEWTCIVFMILGGVSFPLLLCLCQRRIGRFWKSTELKAYLAIIAIATAIVATSRFSTLGTANWIEATIRESAFQVVSIMTTTGYSTRDYAAWASLPQMTLLLLMIVGGCSGSTAGGIKVARLVVALKTCAANIEQSIRSRVVRQIRMNARPVGDDSIRDIALYLELVAVILASSLVVVSVFERYLELNTNLSMAFACLFNVGPGLAEVGPTHSYAFLNPYTKVFLSLLMILGRLELYAILALFTKTLWVRFD